MANKVVIKRTSVSGREPTASDIDVGELAVNLADAKLFTKDGSGTVIQLGGGSGSGDVEGPTSSTDNAIARFDTTTGKLIQNSVVIVDDTGSITGVNALTAESLVINNDATIGSSNTDTLDVKSRIVSDLDPNSDNAKDIGSSGRNWRDGFFGRTLHTVNLELTGTTSFDGSEGTSGQVLTSAGTGNTPTWTTPTIGTVTSVAATGGTGISISGSPITSSGTLTITNTAPDQTVSLSGGGTTTIGGTYPSFTISSSDQFTGTVTSVEVSGGTTGLTTSGGPITGSGTITLAGTLAVANGGTGSTTAANARTALSAQETLVSGTNIKTVNSTSILGSGNIAVGTVTGVTGTAPIISSGGTAPAISISAATTSAAGSMSSADKTKLDGIASGATANTGTVTSVAISGTNITVSGSPITTSGTITVSIPQAIATSSSVQFGSFGVGTSASGTSGEIRATNNITAYYSDERLKTKIGSIENPLDKVKQIETMIYHANETAVALGYDASIIEVGVTAQSVQKVMPQTVAPAPIDEKYLTVRYERLIPLLIEAIKELESQISELKAK
jgi:hypothetical protein